jgi:hypothetical protein
MTRCAGGWFVPGGGRVVRLGINWWQAERWTDTAGRFVTVGWAPSRLKAAQLLTAGR